MNSSSPLRFSDICAMLQVFALAMNQRLVADLASALCTTDCWGCSDGQAAIG
jgi:hypothetical protein